MKSFNWLIFYRIGENLCLCGILIVCTSYLLLRVGEMIGTEKGKEEARGIETVWGESNHLYASKEKNLLGHTSWVCSSCYITNTGSSTHCVGCGSKR